MPCTISAFFDHATFGNSCFDTVVPGGRWPTVATVTQSRRYGSSVSTKRIRGKSSVSTSFG